MLDSEHGSAEAAEFSVRKAWTLAKLGEIANRGRREGWLAGIPLDKVPDAEELLARARGIHASRPTPMQLLAARMQLSETEVDVLWLLACLELEPMLSAAAQALAAPGAHELNAQVVSLLAGEAGRFGRAEADRLATLGLIETTIDPRVPMWRRAIRAHDRVVELATGTFALDHELHLVAELRVHPPKPDSVHHDACPPELVAGLARRDAFVVVIGPAGSGRLELISRAAAASNRQLLVVECERLATEPEALSRQLRAVHREARLHSAAPVFRNLSALAGRADSFLRQLGIELDVAILATAREHGTWGVGRPVVTVEVALPAEPTRRSLWIAALPDSDAATIEECAARYTISPALITSVAAGACAAAASTSPGIDHVHLALRGHLESSLAGLARRIETKQTWDDLVLPPEQFALLIELVARVKHRHQVLETWGFAEKVGRGTGLAALMSGPPGTGKTMVAGLVARELGLDLYQVDLSRVVSKFIGETEKQLAALFEAAESGQAILLFDEADSLFGKRTEVKSSNDRYANLEVNYLLQRIESFSGICLLTSNHESAIDDAFKRRLAFHIRVPMPDEAHRALLWTAMIPDRAELANDIDAQRLAREFVMAGGYIRNAALRGAFMAAEQAMPISHEHLLQAARREYESMGKLAFESVLT